MAAPNSHPLFDTICLEHRQISAFMSQLTPENNSLQLLHLGERIEELHRKEEYLLFHTLFKNPRLREGGPMCSYFFDQHLSESPIQKIQEKIERPIEIPNHLKLIWQEKSPLCIPISEHLAIYNLVFHLQQQKNHVCLKDINKIAQMISSHFDKEENCLFHIVKNLLTPPELDEILEKWEQFS